MNHSKFAILASFALAFFLCGCGSRESSSTDSFAPVDVQFADTDSSLMDGMLISNVSTREKPKHNARFVLSGISNASTKYQRRYSSTLIDSITGCSFTLTYPAGDSSTAAGSLLGAPNGPANLLNIPAAPGDRSAIEILASGQSCGESILRPELLSARRARAALIDKTSDKTRIGLAFSKAQDDLVRAASPSKPDPFSRFALAESTPFENDSSKRKLVFLERSTACQWVGLSSNSAEGSIEGLSIAPEGCLLQALASSAAVASSASAPKP